MAVPRVRGIATALALTATAVALPVPAQQPDAAALLGEFRWRSLGPSTLGGRIDDIEAVRGSPAIVYAGSANGGVWKTENAGTTWRPVFDAQPNLSIGDIAIAPSNPDIVWVGTGEANSRQSSTYGAGLFKSTDAGRTWTAMGLENSGAIGRILVHPRNPQVVFVAVTGDLFRPHPERGLFKTVDGGRTWTKAKFVDDHTGFIDVAMDPSNPDILVAASYQRRRTAWGFNGGGPGSALWRTVDGGRTWSRIESGGLPPYGQWGRVGLDFSRSHSNVVYAVIEPGPVQGGRGGGRGGAPAQGAQGAPPDPMRPGVWRSEDKGRTWRLMSNENGRPMYFSQVRVDPRDPNTIYVLQRSLAKSTDGGRTFTTLEEAMLRRLQNPGAPSVVPPFDKAATDAFPPSHPDHHAMWINPDDPRHIWLGHDGGVDVSHDAGHSWRYVNWMVIGQFYEVDVDMREPYTVYGGAQDSGIWGIPSRVRNGGGITSEHVSEIALGDGYHVLSDPSDWSTLYAQVSGGGGQHTWRYNLRTGEQKYVRPTPPRRAGAPAGQTVAIGPEGNIVTPLPEGEVLRFNWNPGMALSPHNSSTLYIGANRLFTSRDRGDTWTATADLTRNLDRDQRDIMGVPGSAPMASKHDGVAAWGTIVSVAESPVMPGVLWVGTDDGTLQVSRDGGATWVNVSSRLGEFPGLYYIESIEPSVTGAGTAWVAVDGHHSGDYRPYLFRTTDFGATWADFSRNVPGRGHINVVREDRRNPNLLFVGTETGFYVSIDGGARFTALMNDLPATISDDVVIHPREQDLVLATHGRSFYVLDDITPLQQLTGEVLGRAEHLFSPRPAVLWDHDRLAFHGGAEDIWRARNPPDAILAYYLGSRSAGPVTVRVVDAGGTTVAEFNGSREPGIHRVAWDLRRQENLAARVLPGTYSVRLLANGRTTSTILVVREDPNRR